MGKLFTFTTSAFRDDSLIAMPGFSHRSQPFKTLVTWYPFEEWKVRVYLYARNRSHACRQLLRAGCNDARDLNDGQSATLPNCIKF